MNQKYSKTILLRFASLFIQRRPSTSKNIKNKKKQQQIFFWPQAYFAGQGIRRFYDFKISDEKFQILKKSGQNLHSDEFCRFRIPNFEKISFMIYYFDHFQDKIKD